MTALLAATATALAVLTLITPARSRVTRTLPAVRPAPRPPATPRTHLAITVAAFAAWTLAGPRAGPLAALVAAAAAHRALAGLPTRAAAERDRRTVATVPLFADLTAACLAAGAAPDAAVTAAANALPGPLADDAVRAVQAVRLGVPPPAAWAPLLAHDRPPPVRALARALARTDSGAAPAHALRAVADDARAAARADGEAAARRAAVTAVLPLGLCFLPAFVLAGIVPLVAGLVAHSL